MDASSEPVTYMFERDGYTVVAISPSAGGQTLAGVYSDEDLKRSGDKARSLAQTLSPYATEEKIFAPSVQHQCGEVVRGYRLSDRIHLPKSITLLRNKDLPADGVVLEPRESFLMSTTGALLVASGGGRVIAASATRDSLIDRGRLMGERTRNFETVLTSMRNHFGVKQVDPGEVTVRLFFAYSPQDFAHELVDRDGKSFEYNRRLADYLSATCPDAVTRTSEIAYIDLMQLVAHQCRQLKFKFLPERRLSSNSVFAHARHRDPQMADKRNLMLVRF